jgi:hypothetical protein
MPVPEMRMDLVYMRYRKKANLVEVLGKKGEDIDGVREINRNRLLKGLVGHRIRILDYSLGPRRSY